MTKVKLHAPVVEMHGEFEKNSGIIMRQKKYRAPNGAVLKVGVQESYKIANPRDFDRTPMKFLLITLGAIFPSSPLYER